MGDGARSLEIKEISKDVEFDDNDTLRSQENEENHQLDDEISCNDKSSINQSYEEMSQTDTKVISYKNEAGKYQCGKCEKHFSHQSSLNKHYKSAHEGIKYPC